MSDVFKATPYQKRKNKQQDPSVFKSTKYKTYNTEAIKQLEPLGKQSIDVLNDYSNRINNGEWLDEEDRNAYRSALDTYIQTENKIRNIHKVFGGSYSDDEETAWTDHIASMNKGYDDMTGAFASFANQTEYGHWFEKNKKAREFNSTLSAQDFTEYTEKGAGVANPSWNDAHAPIEIFGWTPFGDGEDIGNMVTFAAANADKAAKASAQAAAGGGTSKFEEIIHLINTQMTDDEKAIYNYYVGKGDKAKADEYLEYITDVLRQRQGGKIAEQIDDTLWEAVASFGTGAQSGFQGFGNFVNGIAGKEGYDTSVGQYAHSYMSENNKGVWKAANDLAYTTGNMTPSILAGTIAGPIAGAVTTGLSSAGNSYAQMIEQGYGKDQARFYGLLTGVAEAGLSYALSGIGALGGKLTGNIVSKAIDGIDNGIARFFVDFGINAVGEGAEEALQSFLEPIFKKWATGEEFEGFDWKEIGYSAMLGMLSAGLLDGVPTAASGIHANYKTNVEMGGLSNKDAIGSFFKGNESGTKGFKGVYEAYKAGKQNVNEMAGYYTNEALELDPENAHAARMQERLGQGKNVSGTQINRMIEANEEAIVKRDKEKIKSASEAEFAELSEMYHRFYGSPIDQSAFPEIADLVVKKLTGEKLTHTEKSKLKKNTPGTVLYKELDPNHDSELYTYDWTGKIGTERIHAEYYNRELSDTEISSAQAEASATESEAGVPTAETETPLAIQEENHLVDPAKMVSESEQPSRSDATPIESPVKTVSTEEASAVLEKASAKYGAQAQAFVHTYTEGQDVEQYDRAYQMAYDMGKSGVSLPYAMQSKATSYLSETKRQIAYEAGQAAAGAIASKRVSEIKAAANGKSGRKKGTVGGKGVTIADLKKTFNDTQNTAYKILCTIAEATGIDIVLYRSEANADGKFEGAQGKFNRKSEPGKIYIDINSGLKTVKDIYNGDTDTVENLAKYAMLRTFSHEFTHFIENWNPVWYNEFRKAVFAELESRGENVGDLIEIKQAQNPGIGYDHASREVIAEAMTDILPDSHFIETLANRHKNIFEKIHEKLKEFLADLRAYFSSLASNPSREANALKAQIDGVVRYLENIVKMFDEGALAAIENYQKTVAVDESGTNVHDSAKDADKTTEIKEATKNAEQGTEKEERSETVHSGGNPNAESSTGRTPEKDGNGSRVSETVGETGSGRQEISDDDRQNRDEINFLFNRENYISPPKNTPLYEAQKSLAEEYGVECYILKASAWKRKNPACSYKGKIYISESIDEYTLKTLVSHEMTHVIKQKGFYPYLDFIDGTSDYLNFTSLEDVEHLFEVISGHRGIDIFDMDENQQRDFFDELNAFVYGVQQGAFINNPDFDLEWIPNAFHDFEAYIRELSDIHEQFKAQVKGKNESTVTVSAEKDANTEPETENYEHFSISENTEYGSLEIKFDGKPSAEIRDMLKKEFGFRWHKAKGVWYGKADRTEIAKALQAVYKAYDIGVKEAQAQKAIVPASKSAAMNELEKEVRNHLLPIVDAYNSGIADEINRQTVAEVDAAKETEAPSEKKLSDFEESFWNATQAERDEVVDAINANNKLTHMRTDPPEGTSSIAPQNIEPTVNNEEEKPNVKENVNNERPILESDADGSGASRLLDEQQTEDVRGTLPEREPLDDTRQREHETSRDGNRTHADARDRRSEGSGESGDLRRDELTAEEAQAKAEELAEIVEEQIEQKSTAEPKGKNFVIGDSLNLPDGEKAKYRANVDAIRLIKKLETEGRYATATEQEILSKYVGWGGLSNAFGDLTWNHETKKREMVAKNGWESEFAELKSLVEDGTITEQEYKDMSASTKNAHYTAVEVIRAMYDGLAQLGFNGGRMLEPSSGVGNFVGAMPVEMSAKVNSWTMVELDRITGQIAKHLYPNADVRIQGFETANIPNNYMDVAIGNVPFGDYGVVDTAYPKRMTKSIHNYFFAKSIDKVRPGGIVMFITSSFTMNSQDETVRRFIMDRADLLGAIRLPNTAFKSNAGTDVVTDILILKKRESGTAYAGEDFLNADYDYEYGSNVSDYFKNHPEMVLGKAVSKSGRFGARTLTYEPYTDRGTIGDQIREAFKNIEGKMDYPKKLSPEKTNFAVERAEKKTKSGGFLVNSDGSISKNENGQLVKVDADENTAKRIAGMLGIRDSYRKLANGLQQGLKESEIKKARKELNAQYDRFVEEYGALNSPANRKAIDSDPDSYSILSLENYDAKKKTANKADIFTKDTISANKTVTHVDSMEEGVIASINLTGGIDVSLIAKLTDKSAEDVTREIIESRLAFKTREGNLVARETYLSGNVRAKLHEAESLAPYDKDFHHNIEELRKVIPADIPYNEIYITPGATFIPNEIYADFIAHMLGGRNNPNSYSGPDVEVGRTASGEFKIVLNNKRLKSNHYNTQTWGTARKSFLDLIDCMMGSRTVKVNDTVETDGKKISVINEAETEAANEKVKAIQKEFEDWLWKDEARRNSLAKLYNETFNAIVNPKYDGSHLSVNGINAEYSLREHQANAVHRIIASGGNTLLAHRVGAGKTLEMAAAAMKMRELGVIKKPVFVVPKSVVAQWGVEFHSYFPAARLLVADDKSFTPANRKIFTNKIANGDYDAVIVTYEQFEKIPMSAEYQARFYEEQIDEIINAIAEEKAESRDGKGLTVKEMEKKKSQLEKKLKELTSKPKDENNVDFEMLGIDSLFVDEAHNFKNLEYVSKMSNVAGLGSTKGVQRAFDLYTKVRYLQGLNGGRGVVFATATPVMNSMVELYIMQRYLQPDVLDQLGLKSFDAWAKQFGEVVNKWEINPSGTGMRQKQVFANFRNLNELQLLFRSFADVLTEVPGLKIPKMKGGAVKIVECEPGEFQKNYMQKLQKRAENVKKVDPSEDNMLKITSDGRKVSYTQRMIDPSLPYEPDCKIFKASENIVKEYQDSADIKGTQIVFLDMATPKGTDKSKAETNEEDSTTDSYDEESAKLYEDMRDYLAKKGIPKREIAFIHEADTDAKRKQLFEDVNAGKVRVLMGSTGKMGVGMNAQKRVVAIHHLDAPWRPGDVEQRDGRAFRQKNMNEEVSKYVYVTKGSFDSRLWDILDRKQHFISQIMNGEDVGRTAEDTGEVTLSAAEVKALASGNPLIEEQTKLTDEIKKLENLQKAYNSSIRLAKTKLADDETKIANGKNRIAGIREDIKTRVDTYSDGKFSMTVGKQTFSDKKEAGAALAAEITAKANISSFVTVGKFAGFELRVIKNGAEYNGFIHGKESYKFNIYLNNTTRMVNHIGDIIAGFENMIKNLDQFVAEASADRDVQTQILAKPFEKQTELDSKRARFNEVMELLSPKNEQQLGKTDDDAQEQSREYLEDDFEDEQYQQRVSSLTDREVLEIAASEIDMSKLTPAEQDALNIFKDRLDKLKDLQNNKAPRSQIQKAAADVLSVQEKAVLQRVLTKARKIVEDLQRDHDREILRRWRDRRNNAEAIKKYRDRLKNDSDDLKKWILKPDNKNIDKHVPDVLKNTVITFLESLNFMSKRSLKGGAVTKADEAFLKKMQALNAAMTNQIDVQGMYSGYSDLPTDFMTRLEDFINSTKSLVAQNAGDFVINRMTSDELKDLSQIVRTLKTYIINLNRFHHNAMFAHISDAGDNSIDYLQSMKKASGFENGISNFLFWQQMRPAYAFERFGEGGKSIYDELRRGQAKLAFNTKEIINFSEKTYSEKEVHAWEDEIQTFNLGGDNVKIPVSHMMALYELSKDPDGKRHILGGGIRVAVYKQKGKNIADDGHTLTEAELNQILDSLTDRQKDVADALQQYMADQGGKWGNYVSVARFGEEQFTNKTYFPISSDGRYLPAKAEKKQDKQNGSSLYALLNMSFTKQRNEHADNRVMIYSIFDVFANHMADMAQYNAMALPILDAIKWINYQQTFVDNNGKKVVTANLREQMERVYGVSAGSDTGFAEEFVTNIIKAFNGTAAQGTPYDSFGLKSLRRYNMAQVAYNFRVVIQQPMAITRAGMLIDYKSILKGMKMGPAAIKQNIEEMQMYSGIAAWKSLGFYDINISRGLTHLIKHDSSALEKIGDVGMWGAEKADTWAWAAMWNACKEEVIRKQKLKPSDNGFYEAVTALFEDVVYKTQVVDSVLTKNEFMRDKGAFARLAGSFMSEATTNASMLLDAYDKYNLDIKGGMTKQQAWKKHGKKFGRTVYVYSVGAILLAAVQSLSDAWRDDDEYEEYGEKYGEAFIGNLLDELMPFNKLPIVSDFYDLGKELLSVIGVDTYGNLPSSVYMQWADSLIKWAEIIHDKIAGENTNYTWYASAYKLLQAVSGATGLPLAAATREIVTAWNNTVGAMAPSLKVITYEATETETRNALYDAILSGDQKETERIKLEKYGADQKKINAALRKALRENDPRIREAAEAAMSGKASIRNKLYRELLDEGNFPKEIISGAIAAEIEAIKKAKNQ